MRMRTGTLLVLAALLVSTAGAQPRRFAVAIVRQDGRLVPFAAWNGAEWERAWPEGYETVAGTPSIDDVPSVWSRQGERVPRLWRVWPAAGGGPLRARVRGLEIVEAHCGSQIALKTDLPEPKRKDPEAVVEGRFGVAVDDSTIRVSAIETLRRQHPLWREAERIVRAGFDAREAAHARTYGRALPNQMPIPSVRVTKMYRQAGAPRSPLHFEAERAYRTRPFFGVTECPSRTVMSGWLVPTTGGPLALVDPSVFITDCDGKEIRTSFPLGAAWVGRRSFWVIQEHGWEDENYHIVEIGPAGVRDHIEFDGGGC